MAEQSPGPGSLPGAQFDARGRIPRALVRWGLSYPRAVLALWSFLVACAAPGVWLLEIETSTDSVLDRASEAWSFYEDSQRRFGGDEILTILIEADTPFSPDALREITRLTHDFERIEGVRRVDSLATVPLVWASPQGELSLEPALSGDSAFATADSVEALRTRVLADRIAPRTLLSSDEMAFAVNLVLEQGAERHYAEILAAVRRELSDQDAYVSGVPVFRTEADTRTRRELLTFVPLTVALVGALLLAIFRTWRAIVVPMVSAGVGTWVIVGVMGALGVPITIATVLLPSILLALGCAYSMHLLNVAAGKESPADLEHALMPVALPVALSGLTTAVGFVAISSVRIDAIRDVGTYGALGVLVVLGTTLTAGPALLRLIAIPARPRLLESWLSSRGPAWIVHTVRSHTPLLLGGWAIALGLLMVGIGAVKVETDVIVWFPRDDPIRVAYDRIRSKLSGISPMNIVIEAEKPGGSIATNEVLRTLDRLTRDLEALPAVGRAISIADPLRQIHGGFIGDASNPLPTTEALVEQYLLLLEAKPYVNDLITRDRSAANVILRVDDNSSNALLDVESALKDLWTQYGTPGINARATGIMYEFARAEDEIAWGQLRGLFIAFAAVGLILLAIFRSPGLALIVLVPNAVPIGMAFGVMGLLSVPLDAGTVILGSLALGIAVDDTIHVTEGYVRARLGGTDPLKAVHASLDRVMAPLVYTTIAVALGFSALAASGFTLTRNLGLLTAGVMLLCLLADLLLLPVLLAQLGRWPKVEKAN